MSKEMTVIVLGLLVVVLPHLGIPGTWRTALLLVLGLVVAGVGFLLRGEALSRGSGVGKHSPFVENSFTSESTDTRNERKDGISSLN